jgi:transcriptional regulator with GAF, ATPase, and Fis domain
MEPFSQLTMDVWREACRHLELGESISTLAPILLKALPVDVVIVRRIDAEAGVIETIASGVCGSGPNISYMRDELSTAAMNRLVQWCRQNKVQRVPADSSLAEAVGLTFSEFDGSILAGPLNAPEGPEGLLVLVARAPHSFDASHERMTQLLLEPFTIWFENDRRLRELRSQREAAEADKASLLARLGRTDLNDTIVGAQSGLKLVMDQVELVSRADVPVLILGETGSGKEVVARSIHSSSRRSHGPFLRVNCGAIPGDLVDSELFGHEKGSFTGAIALRKGWFERADGGTLFLDECGELPPAAQVRLLRILQDGTFERVGGEQQIHVNVRVVAATHRNLEQMVREGKFREDLWYRLAVFPIHLPALRERLGDIADLATHFAIKASRRLGLPPVFPTKDDIQHLSSYRWPGNVRELSAVIERAALLGEGKRLDIVTALGIGGVERRETAPAPEPAMKTVANGNEPFPTLDEAMAIHIEAALARCKGRIEGPKGAAHILGINPHTLRARMRKLKVDWSRYRGSM